MNNTHSLQPARDYYVIESETLLEALAAHVKEAEELQVKTLELCQEVGAIGYTIHGGVGASHGITLTSLNFKGRPAPDIWKPRKRGHGYVPRHRSTLGRVIEDKMKELCIGAPTEIFQAASCREVWSGNKIVWPMIIPEVLVLVRPRDAGEEPQDFEGFRRIEEWEFAKLYHEYNEQLKELKAAAQNN